MKRVNRKIVKRLAWWAQGPVYEAGYPTKQEALEVAASNIVVRQGGTVADAEAVVKHYKAFMAELDLIRKASE